MMLFFCSVRGAEGAAGSNLRRWNTIFAKLVGVGVPLVFLDLFDPFEFVVFVLHEYNY